MTLWIVIAGLYIVGIGFFRRLGGVGAAGEAFRSWGRATADRKHATVSSS